MAHHERINGHFGAEAVDPAQVWFLPTTEPFRGIMDDTVLDDLTPFVGFEEGSVPTLVCGVDSPSAQAAKIVRVKPRSGYYDLFTPLLFPHVMKYIPTVTGSSVKDAVIGIDLFLSGGIPNTDEVSHEVIFSHDMSSRVWTGLDPSLAHDIAMEAYAKKIPFDFPRFTSGYLMLKQLNNE